VPDDLQRAKAFGGDRNDPLPAVRIYNLRKVDNFLKNKFKVVLFHDRCCCCC
jgi:hypothetical protein